MFGDERFKILPRYGRIKDLVEKVSDLSSCEFDNRIIRCANKLKKKHSNNDIAIIHTSIDFDLLFNKNNTKQQIDLLLEDVWGAYFDDDMKIHEDFTFTLINKFTQEGKIIFCWTDFIDYGACLEEGKDTNEVFTHSTLTIFTPYKNNKYHVYQFNPHGRCQLDYTGYTKYISRKRTKYFDCKKGLDLYVIGKFIDVMNKSIKTYHKNGVDLLYNDTPYHNYFGANLQSGDKFGCCYLFPFVIFYEFCIYYRRSHLLKYDKDCYYRFRSFKSLFKECKFEECIYVMMSKYFKEFKIRVIESYKLNLFKNTEELEDELESILERNGSNYIKLVIHSTLDIM